MNERTWCMLIHFSIFAGYVAPVAGLIVPIILWQIKKEEFPSVDAHGKMVLNFILSVMLYAVIGFLLTFVLIGIPLLFALSIVSIVFPIIGGIKANAGELWQYPLVIRFV